jgi:hypothetical protein
MKFIACFVNTPGQDWESPSPSVESSDDASVVYLATRRIQDAQQDGRRTGATGSPASVNIRVTCSTLGT